MMNTIRQHTGRDYILIQVDDRQFYYDTCFFSVEDSTIQSHQSFYLAGISLTLPSSAILSQE